MKNKNSIFLNKVSEFVKNMINPSLESHGGWVDVESANEETGVVEMKMNGGCHGCGAAAMTMRYGIQTALMDEFPKITEVLDVTKHATGENPFFTGNPFTDDI
jgi:Fe-S cluster biogenesis protein NfuA|tara:strand:- start:533 stop:841 length:309 start_codon:yes stop_codon:yes gene_type:complete